MQELSIETRRDNRPLETILASFSGRRNVVLRYYSTYTYFVAKYWGPAKTDQDCPMSLEAIIFSYRMGIQLRDHVPNNIYSV